jgi:SPP1 family predicted phage head-tail adaptor
LEGVMLAAGKMTERVTVQKRSGDTRDALGSQTDGWITHATVWAERVPGRRDEAAVTGQLVVQARETFRVRYRADLLETMRIQWRSQPHEIVSITPDVRRESLTIECTRGIRDGR